MPEDTSSNSTPADFAPPARFTRWWTGFAAESGADNPAVKAMEKVARTGWTFASVFAVLPMVVLALPAIPLVRAGARVQRMGRVGAVAHWVFSGPAVALLWIGRFLGWVLVALLFVRFLTDTGLRKEIADTVKFFAGVAVVGGTFPLINEVQFRLWSRFYRWGMGDGLSSRLASILSYVIWFALVGVLIYFGIVTAAPWDRGNG